MRKTISNEEILDAVYDMADARGMRIDEFVAAMQADYAEGTPVLPQYAEGELPAEVVAALESAKSLKRELRDTKRKTDEEAALRAEIAAFREVFPTVAAEEIPEEVWAEVAEGMDLKHAYALYALTGTKSDDRAEEVNREAAERSAAATGDGSTEPSFTREQVEKMSARDVAKNYKDVLRSFRNWR